MALKRIQDLGAAATLDGTELVELEQAGGSVQCTTQDIANLAPGGGGGSGDVVGPASSDDAYPALFDGTTGKLLKQGSGALGTAAYTAATAYATAAQGALADTATQPGDLAAIATTGDVNDLTGFPGGTTNFLRSDGTFAAPPSAGSVSWGGITGTLSDQTDLQIALDARIQDAPSDGTGYVRKDGAWVAEAANRNIVTTVSSSSGTTTLDASLGDYFKSSLTENTTIALSNVPAGCTLHLQITQHASTGPYTVAFPAGWDWGEGNSAPTMPTGAGKIMDVIVTTNDGGASGIATARKRA